MPTGTHIQTDRRISHLYTYPIALTRSELTILLLLLLLLLVVVLVVAVVVVYRDLVNYKIK